MKVIMYQPSEEETEDPVFEIVCGKCRAEFAFCDSDIGVPFHGPMCSGTDRSIISCPTCDSDLPVQQGRLLIHHNRNAVYLFDVGAQVLKG